IRDRTRWCAWVLRRHTYRLPAGADAANDGFAGTGAGYSSDMTVTREQRGRAIPAERAGERALRRDVGRTALMFTSVGSVIGSGWLLGAFNATKIAGPAAIISWVIGALAILV